MAGITWYLFSIGYGHYLSLPLGNIRLKIRLDADEPHNRICKRPALL
jgi:hypothetical protein